MLSELLVGLTIGVHAVSYHAPNPAGLNNFNPGLYVKAESGLTVGAFRNSFKELSAYVGYTGDLGPFSLTVGGIYYDRPVRYNGHRTQMWSESKYMPMVMPSVHYEGVRLTYLPKQVTTTSSVLHLSLEKKW